MSKFIKVSFVVLAFVLMIVINAYTMYLCMTYTPQPPTQADVAEYIKTHNGSAPPPSWYPNGDPWRNLTAKELEAMFEEKK
jgi:hypothetical protein